MQHEGFAFLEIMTQCPTYFGRRAIGSGAPIDGVNWIQEHSVTVKQASALSEEELADKFVVGTFVQKQVPVFAGSSLYISE